MRKEQVLTKLQSIIEESRVGVLSTISKGKPNGRYMTFFNEGITIYTPTNKNMYKIEDMVTNPHVHIILGYEGEGYGDTYAEIEGVGVLSTDEELKSRLWNDTLSTYFSGPNDPNYVVIVIEPKKVTIMNDEQSNGPQVISL
ncbi:pyridoxamine 5'-phosphate oxidase family protein [Bacillus sp. JJ722]|uniref:pyridoxamine 5'-phosphate oxidase family protein n=1 Tax=Bacillus sp. JJ722 TaxID=3122973 RepID=UPI002FFFEA0B